MHCRTCVPGRNKLCLGQTPEKSHFSLEFIVCICHNINVMFTFFTFLLHVKYIAVIDGNNNGFYSWKSTELAYYLVCHLNLEVCPSWLWYCSSFFRICSKKLMWSLNSLQVQLNVSQLFGEWSWSSWVTGWSQAFFSFDSHCFSEDWLWSGKQSLTNLCNRFHFSSNR